VRIENVTALTALKLAFLAQCPKQTANQTAKKAQDQLAKTEMVRLPELGEPLALVTLWTCDSHRRAREAA